VLCGLFFVPPNSGIAAHRQQGDVKGEEEKEPSNSCAISRQSTFGCIFSF